jgi:hypothetical protein
MQEFLSTSRCRRRLLLRHFENPDKIDNDEEDVFKLNCCDNCTARLETSKERGGGGGADYQLVDFSKDALKLLKAVQLLNCRFGMTMVIQFLLGSVCGNIIQLYADCAHLAVEFNLEFCEN